MKATLPQDVPGSQLHHRMQLQNIIFLCIQTLPLSYLTPLLLTSNSLPLYYYIFELRGAPSKKMAMHLQPPSRPHTISNKSLPASSLATIGNAGLRRPSNRFALKSSLFSPSLNLLLLPHLKTTPASAARPRFSMRVASKQSYICRDCGYSFFFFFFQLGFECYLDNHMAILLMQVYLQ